MADWVDASVDQQAILLAASEKVRKPEGPAATGRCLYCGAKLPRRKQPMRWCDADCRDDWQDEQKQAAMKAGR